MTVPVAVSNGAFRDAWSGSVDDVDGWGVGVDARALVRVRDGPSGAAADGSDILEVRDGRQHHAKRHPATCAAWVRRHMPRAYRECPASRGPACSAISGVAGPPRAAPSPHPHRSRHSGALRGDASARACRATGPCRHRRRTRRRRCTTPFVRRPPLRALMNRVGEADMSRRHRACAAPSVWPQMRARYERPPRWARAPHRPQRRPREPPPVRGHVGAPGRTSLRQRAREGTATSGESPAAGPTPVRARVDETGR